MSKTISIANEVIHKLDTCKPVVAKNTGKDEPSKRIRNSRTSMKMSSSTKMILSTNLKTNSKMNFWERLGKSAKRRVHAKSAGSELCWQQHAGNRKGPQQTA